MAPPDEALYPGSTSRNVLEPSCSRCPDLAAARERIAWGNGSLEADVFVVGEAPAAGTPDADRWRGGNRTGLAYTSRHSGRRLRQLFTQLGYGPAELYVTNAVKCFPAAPDDPTTNREPTPTERRRCRTHLTTELNQVEPAVVVPTGRHATASVLAVGDESLEGFLDVVLEPRPLPGHAATVLPLLHPSYEAVWRSRLGYADRAAYIAAAEPRLMN